MTTHADDRARAALVILRAWRAYRRRSSVPRTVSPVTQQAGEPVVSLYTANGRPTSSTILKPRVWCIIAYPRPKLQCRVPRTQFDASEAEAQALLEGFWLSSDQTFVCSDGSSDQTLSKFGQHRLKRDQKEADAARAALTADTSCLLHLVGLIMDSIGCKLTGRASKARGNASDGGMPGLKVSRSRLEIRTCSGELRTPLLGGSHKRGDSVSDVDFSGYSSVVSPC